MKKFMVFMFLFVCTLLVIGACSNDDSYDSYDTSTDPSVESYDPADYTSEGEYKPVEDMNQDEIRSELEGMLEDSLNK